MATNLDNVVVGEDLVHNDCISREEAIKAICGDKCGLTPDKCINGIAGNCVQIKPIKDLPSVKLEQEPKSEWQQDHKILKAYSDGANEVLNKIRAEIEKEIVTRNPDYETMWKNLGLRMALKVIDKYKEDI